MRITSQTVSQFVGMSGDLTISGKVTRVWDKKQGMGEIEGKQTPWAFQSIIVADETGDINVTFKNRDENLEKNIVGKHVTISSKATKNGILGVKVAKEEWKDKQGADKSKIAVIVTSAAIVNFEGEQETPEAPHNVNPGGVTNPEDIDWEEGSVKPTTPPTSASPTSIPKPVAVAKEPEDPHRLEKLRRITIEESVDAWKKALPELSDPSHPAHKEIWSAMILAAGRNADTVFIAKSRG